MTCLELRNEVDLYRQRLYQIHDKLSQATHIIHQIEEILFDIEDAEGYSPSAIDIDTSDDKYHIADEYFRQLKTLI